MKKLFFVSLLFLNFIFCQQINWSNITSKFNLPSGIQIYEGSRTSPALKVYYVDADMNNNSLSVRPYISNTIYSVDNFNKKTGAYVSVNGGFFGGNVSYSSVIYPGEVKATNVGSLTRNSKSYPVIRSLFSIKNDKTFSVDWIYHFGNTINDIYKFSSPMTYISNDANPQPAPVQSGGEKVTDILAGIGGAPMLIKKGIINITYNEEIMWGSGVGYDNRDPRTAVGYTNTKHIIMLVADGRSGISEGVSLPELAQIMSDLGCYEAINLDGGGSSQMAIDDKYVNTPAGIRAVPSILSIVHADSMKQYLKPVYEKIIDTEEAGVLKSGNWFETANSGYYGNSKSLLIAKGTGSNYIKYNLFLPTENKYDVYAWWVSASNRCSDTPYIINHKNGVDTVKIDQTKNGSSWQKIGTYIFKSDSTSFIKISDAAKIGTYVTADAIKVISSESPTSVTDFSGNPESFILHQNYPNPFNPSTNINYSIPEAAWISLKVFDLTGKEITTLVDEFQSAGDYSLSLTLNNSLSSGVYFYRLTSGSFSQTKKMIYIK